MKLETAYQVEELVRKHRDAIADADRMEKTRNTVVKGNCTIQVTYLDEDGDLREITDFGEDDREDVFNFLVEIYIRKANNIQFELDKIFPEIDTKISRVIRISYQEYLDSLDSLVNSKDFDKVLLTDLVISGHTLHHADEIWLVSGDHQRALKRKITRTRNPEPLVPGHPDYVGAFQKGKDN